MRVSFLLIRSKGHWEAIIVELGRPNYFKVGAKMTNLEGNKVDVLGAIRKGPGYKYFGATKLFPDIK
jgi:pre-mRNA-splicing factor ISY1